MPASTAPVWVVRLRTTVLPIVLWAFGFATTMLLIGMWGRTVAVDSPTVQETAKTVVDSGLARERIYDWLEAGLATASGADSETARALATAVADRPEFSRAADAIIDDFIAGLFAEEGEDPVLHVEEALAPLVPVVVAEADQRDLPVEPSRIEEALDAASVIQLDTGEARTVAAVVDEAHGFLTLIVLLAGSAMVVAGTVAVALAERPYAMVRTLGTRVVVSAFTYAILFRVGSWALDPQRGRSPVLGGGSVLLGSNSHVFVVAGIVAAVIAATAGWIAWRRSRTPTAQRREDDDTRELVPV